MTLLTRSIFKTKLKLKSTTFKSIYVAEKGLLTDARNDRRAKPLERRRHVRVGHGVVSIQEHDDQEIHVFDQTINQFH